jgi:hypothetical protein
MTTCSHLAEIRQSLAAGHWPHAAAPELLNHAESCTRCAQEVLLTTHFQTARAETLPAVQPASANLLWWRAQLRRRNAALTRAARPIAAAQIFALAVVLIAMAALVATHWHSVLAFATPDSAATLPATGAIFGLTPLILTLAITLITTLSGIAVYLSTDRQ